MKRTAKVLFNSQENYIEVVSSALGIYAATWTLKVSYCWFVFIIMAKPIPTEQDGAVKVNGPCWQQIFRWMFHMQGFIDWEKVAETVGFAYIKGFV